MKTTLDLFYNEIKVYKSFTRFKFHFPGHFTLPIHNLLRLTHQMYALANKHIPFYMFANFNGLGWSRAYN